MSSFSEIYIRLTKTNKTRLRNTDSLHNLECQQNTLNSQIAILSKPNTLYNIFKAK